MPTRNSSSVNVSSFICYYCNAQSIKNKLSDLHDLLYSFEFNVVLLSETWLITNLTDALLDPRGLFTIFRKDRVLRAGGGVCILVLNDSNTHTSIISIDYDQFPAEIVGCRLHLKHMSLNFFCVYVAPNVDRSQFKSYIDCINFVLDCNSNCSTFIFGDFNLPHIYNSSSTNVSLPKESNFLNLCESKGLKQVNPYPTRGTSLLDLVLTDDPLLVSDLMCCPPLGTSDHDSLKVAIVCHDQLDFDTSYDAVAQNNYQANVRIFLWAKADWISCGKFLQNICWDDVFFKCSNANLCWSTFLNILMSCLNNFVPTKKLLPDSVKNTKTKLKYPRNVSKWIHTKKVRWRALKSKNNTANRTKYKHCTQMIKNAKLLNELKHEANIINTKNLGAVYKHINSKLTHKTGIAPLCGHDNKLIFDNLAKADLLNKHFVSSGTIDDGNIPDSMDGATSNITASAIDFDCQDIINAISKLKPNSSAGPDGLPSTVFKSLKYQLAKPLLMLFKNFMRLGCLPDQWKTAVVRPIFKKGKASDPNNYRPISLTCVCCKLFESIIKNHLLSHLVCNSLISKTQHGFLSRLSTTTNLIESLNDWTSSLENKMPVKVIYIDFEKAFDKVSIPKLISKLKGIGISVQILQIINSFLTNRFQSVKIGNAQSQFLPVISGVPQGSVLGPFLFLIYINDLPNYLNTSLNSKLFADDLKSYGGYTSNIDHDEFQMTLSRLVDWTNLWQLKLSISKCGSLLITGNSNIDDDDRLFIDNENLSVFDSVRDLGVIVDRSLNFSKHIDATVSKANQRTYLILKSFKSRDISLMVFAFKVYVLPLLDYCSPIWSPSLLKDIDRIENVQRAFTKKLDGLYDFSYGLRLVACNLPSLELRRLWADLVLCFKIIHKLINLNADDFFEYENRNHNTRGHSLKLKTPIVQNRARKCFFSNRIISAWNYLPNDVVMGTCCKLFKRQLLPLNLNKFLVRTFDI